MIDRRPFSRAPVASRRVAGATRRALLAPFALAAGLALPVALVGCGEGAASPDGGSTAAPADSRPMQMSREYWPNGNLKYEYEMRPSLVDGKWKRNGASRAFYDDGSVERSGLYLDNERVGTWTYYAPDGTVARTEERGEGGGAR